MAYLTPDEIREVLSEEGHEDVAETLVATARAALALDREDVDDASIPVGASKLGGDPDLPAGFSWPEWNGRPLAFLGQVRLGDLPRVEGGLALPRSGLLSFFCDYIETPWGFDPAHRGGAVVVHTAEGERLSRVPTPAGAIPDDIGFEGNSFLACRVGFRVVTTYRLDEERLGEDGELLDLLHETLAEGQGDESPHHQIGGHPLVIQSSMELECQLVTNGIYCGDTPPASQHERIEALTPGAADWRLLLQLDTDDLPGWMWGDMGLVYFWIREQDLAAGDFSKVWFVLQCF